MTSLPTQAPGLPGPAGRDKSVLMEVGRLASRVQDPVLGVTRNVEVGRRAQSICESRPVLSDGTPDPVGSGAMSAYRFKEAGIRALLREDDLEHAIRAAVDTKMQAEAGWEQCRREADAWQMESESLLSQLRQRR